jgi:hypothetical protein
MERNNANFQKLINKGKSNEQVVALYQKLRAEERIEAVKELCDQMIVCEPIMNCFDTHDVEATMASLEYHHAQHCLNVLIGQDCAERALQAVVESNYTKLLATDQLDDALKHFDSQGIKIKFEYLDDDYWMAVSACDQTVNGKFYAEGEMLKAQNYRAVDTGKEFWL